MTATIQHTILKADTTELFNKGSNRYKWILSNGNVETTETELQMPNVQYDITNIKDKMSSIGISNPGEYEFLLEVYQNEIAFTEVVFISFSRTHSSPPCHVLISVTLAGN